MIRAAALPVVLAIALAIALVASACAQKEAGIFRRYARGRVRHVSRGAARRMEHVAPRLERRLARARGDAPARGRRVGG